MSVFELLHHGICNLGDATKDPSKSNTHIFFMMTMANAILIGKRGAKLNTCPVSHYSSIISELPS